jgi:hypothetical protein
LNVEIGTEASQFPEKEYINGIFLSVYCTVYADAELEPGTPGGARPVLGDHCHCILPIPQQGTDLLAQIAIIKERSEIY